MMKLSRTAPVSSESDDPSCLVLAVEKRVDTDQCTGSCHCTSSCSSKNDDEHDYVMTQDVADSLVTRTERKVQHFLKRSPIVKANSCIDQLPKYELEELELSDIIGFGGFANIHPIDKFPAGREPSSSDKRYIVKSLKPKLALETQKLKAGAKDLIAEGHVLSALSHPHIVQIKGISSAGIHSFAATRQPQSLFLVLELVDQTLQQRMGRWRQQIARNQTTNSLHKLSKCPKTLALFRERMQIAHDLASALAYLHSHRIVHRDIKPGNVGWSDVDQRIKLYDFGLAVELPPSDEPDKETFRMGNAGTARYLSPEVIQRQPYNCKADVFSLTICLWELLTLERPFQNLGGEEVKQMVAQIGQRPKLDRAWPKPVKQLLQKGWSANVETRPNAAEMQEALAKILTAKPKSPGLFSKACKLSTTQV